MNKILNNLIHLFSYDTVILMKDLVSDVASLSLGFLLFLLLGSFVLKDATWEPDGIADKIKVTKIKPGKRYRIILIVPSDKYLKLPATTVLIIFIQAILVRLLPIKHLYFIDRKEVRFGVAIFLFIVLVVCVMIVGLDFHHILPNKKGGYDLINVLQKTKSD